MFGGNRNVWRKQNVWRKTEMFGIKTMQFIIIMSKMDWINKYMAASSSIRSYGIKTFKSKSKLWQMLFNLINKPMLFFHRATFWYGNLCLSHHMRHGICIFGLEHLALYLVKWPHLFANKFQPDFDWGAALCWYETMHNRSHIPAESTWSMAKLRRDFYEDLAYVGFYFLAAITSRVLYNKTFEIKKLYNLNPPPFCRSVSKSSRSF
jgi:hypothetical protein